MTEIMRIIALNSPTVSLLLLVLFWHPWLILGVLIDTGILIALLWVDWPSEELLGR